jgi:hypothetical protein
MFHSCRIQQTQRSFRSIKNMTRQLLLAAALLGGHVVRVADPQERDPWDVFDDDKFLGNTRVANCSKYLKQEPARLWVTENTDPDSTVLYIGMDWSELGRLPANRAAWAPWRVEYPLTEPPYHDKAHWEAEARAMGLEPPRLYALGFSHNNCGGACVRAGQGQWKLLLEVFPERYAYAEMREQRFRERSGKDVAILRDRRGGVTRPLTLAAFRERIAERAPVDEFDIGGCGCFTAEEGS